MSRSIRSTVPAAARAPIAPTARFRAPAAAASVFAALLLAACGGGGGSDGTNPNPNPNPDPGVANSGALTLSGTAARGQAMAGAAVSAKCVVGSGSTTAGADGSYTLTMAEASLPCLLRAEIVENGTPVQLQAAAPVGARTQTVNISPLTHLVVNRAVSGSAVGAYDNWTSEIQGKLSAAGLSAAVSGMQAVMRSAGMEVDSVGNPMTTTLAASHGSTAGNAHDQLLDSLQGKLTAAGLSFSQLTTAMVQSGNTSVSGSSVVLPPTTWMFAANDAAHCHGLRSGTLRTISLTPYTTSLNPPVSEVTVDASQRRLSYPDGSTDTLVPVQGMPCHYVSEAGDDLVVSAGSVGVIRYLDEQNSWRMAIGIPKQNFTVAEMAGEWNAVVLTKDSSGARATQNLSMTIDAAGQVTAMKSCLRHTDCIDRDTTGRTWAAHEDGGLTFYVPGGSGRAYFYRTAGGAPMGVLIASDGTAGFMTPKVEAGLSTVGSTGSSYSVGLNGSNLASTFGVGSSTTRSVDSAAGSWLRDAVINTSTGATRPETLLANTPLPGFLSRKAETVVASDGSSSSVSAWTGVSLRGTGLFSLGAPNSAVMSLSVSKP